MVDIEMLEKVVQSPFLWSILCLIVAITYFRNNESNVKRLQKQADGREKSVTKLYEEHKKESREREDKLMNHLEKTTETLQNIEHGISKLEGRMNGGFNDIWEQIDTIKKGDITK